jgi:hypothetical protein
MVTPVPPAPQDPERLPALVAERGLVTVRELASLIAGEPIRGSWWAHPRGHDIVHALGALDDHPDILLVKLIEGKQTLVHRRLWPALNRIQLERSLWPPVSAEAAALLENVRRLGRAPGGGKPRLELERALLVIGEEEHTASGAHRVVLVPFADAFPAEIVRAASRLPLSGALAELSAAGFSPDKVRRSGGKAAAPRARRKGI